MRTDMNHVNTLLFPNETAETETKTERPAELTM
jgi:hypothetical protein